MTWPEFTSTYLVPIGAVGAIIAAIITALNTQWVKSRELNATRADKRADREVLKAHSINELSHKLERTMRAFVRLSRVNPPLDATELIDETIAAFSRLSEFTTTYDKHRIYLTDDKDVDLYRELIRAFVRLNLALNLDVEHQRKDNYRSSVESCRTKLEGRATEFRKRCNELIRESVRST